MTTSTQNNFQAIEETMFPTPSGTVRGVINANMQTKKGEKVIAKSTLTTDGPATISLSLPSSVTPDELDQVTATLRDFAARVRVLDIKP
jgi:hypothetical protein